MSQVAPARGAQDEPRSDAAHAPTGAGLRALGARRPSGLLAQRTGTLGRERE
jgi:hypothetical protein